MSHVVAVSAPVGGGKTSLVRGLARAMGGAAVHFDHYETLTDLPLEVVKGWMEGGGDIDELPIPGLANDLARLRAGEAITDPASNATIAPAELIFFETPFARRHRESGAHIDLAIWIDTPLDVALARNLREFLRRPELRDDLESWLGPYLDGYLDAVRDMLLMQQRVVGGDADLTLDGMGELEDNVAVAEREIRARLY